MAFTDTYKKMAEAATQILGPWTQLWRGAARAPDGGRWAFQALFGERLLGLPRG